MNHNYANIDGLTFVFFSLLFADLVLHGHGWSLLPGEDKWVEEAISYLTPSPWSPLTKNYITKRGRKTNLSQRNNSLLYLTKRKTPTSYLSIPMRIPMRNPKTPKPDPWPFISLPSLAPFSI